MYKIQCRIDWHDPITKDISIVGSWQNYSKKYNTIQALFDAWRHYSNLNYEGCWSQGCEKKGYTKWKWRMIHWYGTT